MRTTIPFLCAIVFATFAVSHFVSCPEQGGLCHCEAPTYRYEMQMALLCGIVGLLIQPRRHPKEATA
jgi:hypothetical protein